MLSCAPWASNEARRRWTGCEAQMTHARAILWAQWRTTRNVYLRSNATRSSAMVAGVFALMWYGMWAAGAFLLARVLANPVSEAPLERSFPDALLLMFLYWQVVPLLLAA